MFLSTLLDTERCISGLGEPTTCKTRDVVQIFDMRSFVRSIRAQPPNHSCVRWIQNSVVEACPIPGRNSTVSKPIPLFCHLPEPYFILFVSCLYPVCSVSFHLSTFLHLNSCSFIETEAESSGLTFFKGQENRSPQIRHIQGGCVNFFCSTRGPNRA